MLQVLFVHFMFEITQFKVNKPIFALLHVLATRGLIFNIMKATQQFDVLKEVG